MPVEEFAAQPFVQKHELVKYILVEECTPMKMMTHDKMGGQGAGFEGSGWATDAAITLDPPDPAKSGPFCAPRAPFAARRARALHLGGTGQTSARRTRGLASRSVLLLWFR